ncbi:MAG: hypothetical protein HZB57_08580 [Gammaproteobacteria bacterium]|nr:hypothetical protein [Gammaproteobacteria bacterium]
MKIDSSVAALGLLGVQKGMQGMRESAATIASAEQASSSDANSTAEALVALKQHAMQVEISAKVIDQANETIGSLIDILA